MKCPVCGSRSNRAVDSRPEEDCNNRRRMCSDCGHRWNTIEIDADQWGIVMSAFKLKKQKEVKK